MKVRRLTVGNWVELVFGALLPTLFWGPGLLLGLVVSLSSMNSLRALGAASALVGGLLAFAALWIVLLFGPEAVALRPRLRVFVLTAGVIGCLETLGLGRLVLFAGPSIPMPGFAGALPVVALLVLAPALVGLRYLGPLLRGGHEVR
jgi:hypothetical protein